VAINSGKVVVGGIAAGVVMNLIDMATNLLLLKDRMTAEMNALNPKLAAAAMAGSSIAGFIVVDFVCAFCLIWLYAAIRPRFGPGPGTATRAALVFWLFGGAIWASVCLMGMFSWGFWCITGCVYLVNLVLAANVGAMLYKEE
jgi:hypothetical protein